MKKKKALKRLDSVEVLLSDVIDGYQEVDGLKELLDSAKAAVFQGKAKVTEAVAKRKTVNVVKTARSKAKTA